MKPIVTTIDKALKKLMHKTIPKYPLTNFLNKWIKTFVPDKGDNWIECEGDLWGLIQYIINKERERYAKIAESTKTKNYTPTIIDINAYINENADLIAKIIRKNK